LSNFAENRNAPCGHCSAQAMGAPIMASAVTIWSRESNTSDARRFASALMRRAVWRASASSSRNRPSGSGRSATSSNF